VRPARSPVARVADVRGVGSATQGRGAGPRYARSMESIAPGELVTLSTTGAPLDGIVVDLPSATKAVVAVVDRKRGPVLRTVDRQTLSERAEPGADDRALQLLIRRTPSAVKAKARGGANASSSRDAHTRAAMHRTTGK